MTPLLSLKIKSAFTLEVGRSLSVYIQTGKLEMHCSFNRKRHPSEARLGMYRDPDGWELWAGGAQALVSWTGPDALGSYA